MWFEVVGFGVGLLLGSFLNVCISRLPEHESIVRPGSRCLSCGHAMRWFDNVPILSWVLLRGKCRDCGAGISWRYPAVELAVGVWFALAADQFVGLELAKVSRLSGPTVGEYVGVVGFASIGFLLIGLMVMDWQTQRLPDAFTLTGIGIGFVLVCVQAMFLAPGEGDVVLNTTHQLRMSSPGSSAGAGECVYDRAGGDGAGEGRGDCRGGADSAGGAVDLQGAAQAGWDGVGRCEAAGDDCGVSGVRASRCWRCLRGRWRRVCMALR